MKNLKADPSMELTDSTMVPPKLGSPSDAASCISSADATASSVKETDFENESMPNDTTTTPYPYPTDAYYGYYYPGCTEQGYYMGGEGMELQYPVMQADNGSLVYLMPGIQTSYGPYSPYVPQQQYSPSSMFQHAAGYIQTSLPYGELVQAPYLWDPSMFVGDGTAFGQSYYGIPETHNSKPILSSTSHTPSNFNNPVDGHGKHTHSKTSTKMSNGPTSESGVFGKGGYFSLLKHPLHNQGKGGMQHLTNPVSLNANRRAWGADEKVKPRSKVCSIGGEVSLLNDQGPRTASVNGFTGGNAVGHLAAAENKNHNNKMSMIRRDQYNLPDLSTKYDHALFFVIKSYSEDDIHKSIKYNVWASTPNGNKRLDSAYQDAERKAAEKGSKCPVFLFFSVNASGQFCGVAEMIGRVDFNKSMDFWQQDKWSGYFPVKWHIIKDVPNLQLRRIILENNDNKPVTNSRDTQEVRFPQGIEMLDIFKNYESKTSVLDDFEFYESRQKVMQEKKVRPSIPYFDPVKEKVEEISSDFQSIDLSGSRSVIVDGIKGESVVD